MKDISKRTPVPKENWARPESVARQYSKPEKRALWIGSLVATALFVTGAMLHYKQEQADKLPDPEKTGQIVKVIPKQGEGENQLVNELARPGFDSSELRDVVEAAETDTGALTGLPFGVDTGFLTTQEDVLLQYGVQPQDIQPK